MVAKKFPILLIFYISWIIFIILGVVWSFLMHIDVPTKDFLYDLFSNDMLYAVLVGYVLSTLLSLYFLIPVPSEEEKKENKNS